MDVDGRGANAEDRAADVLERLTDCGLAGGLTEEDVYGRGVREPFRTLCSALADRIAGVHPGDPPQLLRGAANAVRRNAASESASGGGRLDTSLTRLLRAVVPTSRAVDRIRILEELLDFLQASAVVQMRESNRSAGSTATPMDVEVSPAAPTDRKAVDKSALIRGLAGDLGVAASPATTPGVSCLETLGQCASEMDRRLSSRPPPAALVSREALSASQLALLREVDDALRDDFRVRRRTVVKRAAVCLGSLQHSRRLVDRGGEDKTDAKRIVREGLARMSDDPGVQFSDVFSATLDDLLPLIEGKVTGADAEAGRFEAPVKSVIIGKVPDRGGRVDEGRRVGMPKWAPRSAAASSHGGRNGNAKGNGGQGAQGKGGGGKHDHRNKKRNKQNKNKQNKT